MNLSKKLSIVLVGILFTMALNSIASAQDEYTWDPATSGAFFGMAMLTCVIFAVIWLVVWILVGIWVYKDAEKRGKSGALWLIIVILLGLIGIIIWLVVRGEKPAASARHCPNCGRGIPEDARVCPYCNKKFEEQ